MADITTLDAVKLQLKLSSEKDIDDTFLKVCIGAASRMAAEFAGRLFVPLWETQFYDAVGDHVDGRDLQLDGDLLALTALTNGNGVAYDLDDVLLVPYNSSPKDTVRIKATGAAFTYSSDPRAALQVTGAWGYHSAYARAWIDTLDAVKDAGGITDSATSITVEDADEVDARGLPRFAVLGYYRIEDELVQVTAVDTATNILTVRRAQQGTDAAAHAVDTAIQAFEPEQDVEQACIALAVWLYRNRATVGEKIRFLNGTAIDTNQAPSYIKDVLSRYQRLRMYVV